MKKYTTPWTNQKMNPMDVQHRIECYVGMVQQKMNDYWELADYDHDEPPIIYAEYGKKYARIVHSAANRSSRSVHTFVNMINGGYFLIQRELFITNICNKNLNL